MRSRDTPKVAASSSRVFGCSARNRSPTICRSRGLRSASASFSALHVRLRCSVSDSRVSGSGAGSISQSWISSDPSSRVMGKLSEVSPRIRPFISTTSRGATFSSPAIYSACCGDRSTSSLAEIRFLSFRRLKNSFFWAAVVPIFTSDQDLRMYSWTVALIHHIAYVASRTPFSGWKRFTASIRPTFASEIRSATGRP